MTSKTPQSLALCIFLCLGGCASAHASQRSPDKAPPYVMRGKDVSKNPFGGSLLSHAKVFYHGAAGSDDAALSLLTLEPGSGAPAHQHPESSEFIYILSGQVEMEIEGEIFRAGAGDAVRIPAGTTHSVRVISKAMVQAVQLYVGPGPEQRFLQHPARDAVEAR